MIARVLIVLTVALASIASAGPDAAAKRRASAHYKQGKAYFDAGAFDKAVTEFRAAYDIAPANPILFNIARSYHLAGQRHDASDWYNRYLAAEAEGSLADEARQYLAEIAAQQDAEAAAHQQRDAAVEQERKRDAAAAHAKQAQAYTDAGAPRDAVPELAAAFELDGDPEHLFAAGEAVRGVDPAAAIAQYRHYLDAAPSGPHADEARRDVAALTHQLEAKPVVPAPLPDLTLHEAPPPPPKHVERASHRWYWWAASAVLVGVGVVLDRVPASAHDGLLEPMDLVPIALYGLGATSFVIGVF